MMKRGLVAESQIKYSLLNIFLSTMYQDNKTQMQYLNLILEIECMRLTNTVFWLLGI